VQIFTNDRKELLHALSRPDDPMSGDGAIAIRGPKKPTLRNGLKKVWRSCVGKAYSACGVMRADGDCEEPGAERGLDHER